MSDSVSSTTRPSDLKHNENERQREKTNGCDLVDCDLVDCDLVDCDLADRTDRILADRALVDISMLRFSEAPEFDMNIHA